MTVPDDLACCETKTVQAETRKERSLRRSVSTCSVFYVHLTAATKAPISIQAIS